jgi:hypothetical protein
VRASARTFGRGSSLSTKLASRRRSAACPDEQRFTSALAREHHVDPAGPGQLQARLDRDAVQREIARAQRDDRRISEREAGDLTHEGPARLPTPILGARSHAIRDGRCAQRLEQTQDVARQVRQLPVDQEPCAPWRIECARRSRCV